MPFASRANSEYPRDTSPTAAKLLADFEALPARDKQDFVREIVRRLPPWDSGELSDDVAAAAGDEFAATLEREERHDRKGAS